MNLLTEKFGATGKVTIDLDQTGLHLAIADTEKLSDQSLDFTVKPEIVVDSVVGLFGSPAWLVSIGAFLKAELAAFEAK